MVDISDILERESAFRRVGLFNFSVSFSSLSFYFRKTIVSRFRVSFSTEQRACLIKAATLVRLVAKQMQHITNVHHLPLSATTLAELYRAWH